MKKYARVQENIVVEYFETDGDIGEMFHPSWIWVDVTDLNIEIGQVGREVSGKWEFTPPEPQELDEDLLKMSIVIKRDALLLEAESMTLGMSDAFITGVLSEEEATIFKAFAVYKLDLGKITIQPNYPYEVIWPTKPNF